jgi:hypothetical protein
VILVVALLALLALAPAAGAAVLAEEDSTELANALAEATAAQGVCYGWRIEVSDFAGTEGGLEAGSNFGPGTPLDRSRTECREGLFVELVGDIVYTSETSESEDSAAWDIESNLEDAPDIDEVEALGYDTGDLLGDDNDLAIINAAGALPQLVAEHGQAEPVPFEPAAREPGTSGAPSGDTGNDLLRENGTLILLCLALTLGGLSWLWLLRRDARRPGARHERERNRSTPTTP